jgi:hypothetical protein
MTAQALAGLLAGTTVALLVLYAWLWHASQAVRREAWNARRKLSEVEASAVETSALAGNLTGRVEGLESRKRELEDSVSDLRRASAGLAAEQMRRELAEAKVEELQLELARRRHGPLVEGETVAMTTPQGATIRGVVRQTFDNGAVLLGAAVVLDEVRGRDGVTVEERPAGDVTVPAHEWAQRLPPAPVEE